MGLLGEMRRVLCLLFSILFVLCCKRGKEGKQEVSLPDAITLNFQMEESFSGERLYRLFAEKAVFYEEEGVIQVSGVRIFFFSEGKIVSSLTTDEGRVFIRTSDLVARGMVRIATEDSIYLMTDSLSWNNRRQRIETDAWVKIISPSAEIEGEGLVSDASLSKITIKSRVKGESSNGFK
uniref:LPS export ABC transporter periplasmic protein LptC n=1 Tax=candidate division WOR-3 bacterium TaxID=2052148 RepID=A0A7C3UZT1_UNCW3